MSAIDFFDKESKVSGVKIEKLHNVPYDNVIHVMSILYGSNMGEWLHGMDKGTLNSLIQTAELYHCMGWDEAIMEMIFDSGIRYEFYPHKGIYESRKWVHENITPQIFDSDREEPIPDILLREVKKLKAPPR